MKHIRILVLILCACFVSVAWGQQPAGKGRADWTEFHRTNMMRWNPYENVLNVNNVGNLRLKWSYSIGDGLMSSPAVANGVVYVGSDDHNVYALKASTGAKLWSYTTGGCGGFLARRGEWGGLCRLVRLQRVRAERRHRRQAVELHHRRLVDFLAHRGEWGGVCRLVSDGNVYALNASTGALLWSYATAAAGGFLARGGEWSGLCRLGAPRTTCTR